MRLAEIVPVLLQWSIVLTVFSFALGTRRGDATYLLRHPSRFLVSVVVMHLVTPLTAILFAITFDLPTAVEIVLITLSVSPVAPLLPRREVNAGGHRSYAVSLFALTALIAAITIPFVAAILGNLFDEAVNVPQGVVARVVFITVIIPLVLGIVTGGFAPSFAARLGRPIGTFAMLALVTAAFVLLVHSFNRLVSLIGNGTVLAILAFCLSAIAVGHLLGGDQRDERVVLALSNSTRHPAVALTVATIAAPGRPDIAAAIVLYLLVNFLATTAYLRWVGHHRGSVSQQLTPRSAPSAG